MTRAEAVSHISLWLGGYLAAVGRTATDNVANLKPAIDAALLAMGVARADLATATPTDDEGYEAQLEYRTLKLIVRDLGASSFDVGVGGDSYKLEQVYKHAQVDMAMAEARVLELFGTIGVSSETDTGIVTLDLDFLTDDPLARLAVS